MSQEHILLASGSNARGQLGTNSVDDSHFFQQCSFEGHPPFHLPTQTTRIVDLATGANHTILLLQLSDDADRQQREIWGCGDGSKGQLGHRFGSHSSIFKKLELPLRQAGLGDYSFKLIGATWETSFVVLSCVGKDDVVISMGSDEYGDLGVGGSPTSERVFNLIDVARLFDGGAALVVDSFTSGQRHVILNLRLTYNGKSFEQVMVGWGMSRHGQLGSSTQKCPPFYSTPQIIAVSRQLGPITATSLGLQHSVFLHDSGHLTALGSDRKGQSQIVSNTKGAMDVKCTWNGTYCIVQDGSGWSILSSGSNTHGQLGHVGSAERVEFPDTVSTADTSVQIACGSEHVLALIRPVDEHPVAAIPTSQVWGWGWNEHGNLGVGNTGDAKFPVRIWPLGLDNPVDVSGIWAGCGTSWIYCKRREQ
jgi:protein ATS1